jgi:hypothetical protein
MKAKTKQLIEQFELPFSLVPVEVKPAVIKFDGAGWVKDLLARPDKEPQEEINRMFDQGSEPKWVERPHWSQGWDNVPAMIVLGFMVLAILGAGGCRFEENGLGVIWRGAVHLIGGGQ